MKRNQDKISLWKRKERVLSADEFNKALSMRSQAMQGVVLESSPLIGILAGKRFNIRNPVGERP